MSGMLFYQENVQPFPPAPQLHIWKMQTRLELRWSRVVPYYHLPEKSKSNGGGVDGDGVYIWQHAR